MKKDHWLLKLGLASFFVIGITAASNTLATLDLDQPTRSSEEKSRDINRKPIETMAFFGLEPTMRVIELFPGAGWYTKLLGPYLQQQGQLYIAMGTDRLAPKLEGLGLGHVKVTGVVDNFNKTDLPGFIFSIDAIDLQQRDVDMVLTFRNAHNLTSDTRKTLNRAVFDALKPGGIFGVIDHSRRHMAPLKEQSWRRVDPVQIIKEAVAAGFIFDDYSTIHARAEDDLQQDTRHHLLVNESDRFTFKFIKPE